MRLKLTLSAKDVRSLCQSMGAVPRKYAAYPIYIPEGEDEPGPLPEEMVDGISCDLWTAESAAVVSAYTGGTVYRIPAPHPLGVFPFVVVIPKSLYPDGICSYESPLPRSDGLAQDAPFVVEVPAPPETMVVQARHSAVAITGEVVGESGGILLDWGSPHGGRLLDERFLGGTLLRLNSKAPGVDWLSALSVAAMMGGSAGTDDFAFDAGGIYVIALPPSRRLRSGS